MLLDRARRDQDHPPRLGANLGTGLVGELNLPNHGHLLNWFM